MKTSLHTRPQSFAALLLWTALILAAPGALFANRSQMPPGFTGSFDEPDCTECHNRAGSDFNVSTRIEVGPYVPGVVQRVVVSVISNAPLKGFQMTARRQLDPDVPAGSFSPPTGQVRVVCADENKMVAPCSPDRFQYASHTGVDFGTGGSREARFLVDWKAPETDVGPVVFGAVGLASDGTSTVTGDRTSEPAETVSLFAPSNQPLLNDGGVVSAASFAQNQSISPGAIISIFGQNLAAPGVFRPVTVEDLVDNGPEIGDFLPTELNRLSVEFRIPQPEFPDPFLGRMFFVQPDQVNVQVPDIPIVRPGDPVEIQAVFNRGRDANEVRSNVVEVPGRNLSPALFTLDGTGRNEVAAVHQSGQLVAAAGKYPGALPAAPGEVIMLFGTGFGEVVGTRPGESEPRPLKPGELASGPGFLLRTDVVVLIGGQPLANNDVRFAGAAPNFAGLQQFNIRVPEDLTRGEYPIVIRAGSAATQGGVFLTVGRIGDN